MRRIQAPLVASPSSDLPEVVPQTGLQEADEVVGVLLDGAGLADGAGQAGDADLDQGLVVLLLLELGLKEGENEFRCTKEIAMNDGIMAIPP